MEYSELGNLTEEMYAKVDRLTKKVILHYLDCDETCTTVDMLRGISDLDDVEKDIMMDGLELLDLSKKYSKMVADTISEIEIVKKQNEEILRLLKSK